ncbi:hypothetical protein DSECCO2_613670 [anaerobic digester metagenome]
MPQRIDKPLGRINFLTNKLYGFFCFQILIFRLHIRFKHLLIIAADAQIGHVAGIDHQLQLTIVVVDGEIRENMQAAFA